MRFATTFLSRPGVFRRVFVMKKRGCGIIFYHPRKDAVLVFRRDDAEGIPFPNMLDLLGGHVEEGETPQEAAVREMAEELVDLRTGRGFVPTRMCPFHRYLDVRGCEQNIFVAQADFEIADLHLLEGRELVWLSRGDVVGDFRMAFGFEDVLRRFFDSRPYQNH